MDAAGLRGLEDAALVHQELSWEFELTRALLAHRAEKLDDVSKLKKLRRNIARAKMVQAEREKASGERPGSLRDAHKKSFEYPVVDTAAAVEGVAEDSGGFLSGVSSKLGLSS